MLFEMLFALCKELSFNGSDCELNFHSTIWEIATKSFRGEHFAVYPEKLVEIPVLSCTDVNDLVLDPFMGSGTTAVVAKKNSRNFLGFDLNQEFIDIANNRLNINNLNAIDFNKISLNDIKKNFRKIKKDILQTSELLITESFLI